MNEDVDLEDVAPWLVTFITLIGVGARVLLLATKGMSLAETVNVWLAGHSLADALLWAAKVNQQPPLYYFLLHYWIQLNGDSAYYARLFSVLFSAGTIPFIYLIGKHAAGEKVGLVAAVILAASPFHIYFAQETSMYTLLAFNASVAIYALVRLLTDPQSRQPIGSQFREYVRAWRNPDPLEPANLGSLCEAQKPQYQSRWQVRRGLPNRSLAADLTWIVFILFSALTLLSHNSAVIFLLAVNLFVLGLRFFQRTKRAEAESAFQAPSLKNWAVAQIVILALWAAGSIPLIQQFGTVNQNFLTPASTWDALTQALNAFISASAAIPAIAVAIQILCALLFCLGVVYFRKKLPQFAFLAALFALPLLGELIINLWQPVSLPETLIWTTLPLFLILAAGIAQINYRFLILLVLGSLVTINVFSASDYFRFYQKEDWNTAARDVAGFAKKGDLVLFNSNIVEIPFDYYFEPYRDYYYIEVEEHGVPLDLAESGIPEPIMTSRDVPALLSLLDGHERVWLVYSRDTYTDPTGIIPQTLASQKKLIWNGDFSGGQVQLYGNP
jgi:hypothetical protein